MRKNKKLKYKKKCTVTGKLIDGHEVVITEYADVYVQKQGYELSPIKGTP